MKDKDIVDLWIKRCHDEWLHKYNEHHHLRPATQDLVNKLWEAYEDKDYEKAWECIKRLEYRSKRFVQEPDSSLRVPQSTPEQEEAEVKLECAVAAYYMGNFFKAVELLNDAAHTYCPDYHCEAVTKWMLGCLEWENNRADEAIYWWESCKKQFKYGEGKGIITTPPTATGDSKKWYSEWGNTMNSIIHNAVENEKLEPPPPEPLMGGSTIKKHHIRGFPVLGQIPAGTPASIAAQSGKMEIEEVKLNDAPYRIVSLKPGEHIINVPNGWEYYILRISGNSMNKATPEPIMDGDYVLLRAQETPNDGDIVAAEIVGTDDRATLKRYCLDGKTYFLEPESTDPAFQTPIPFGGDCYIRGVALAVLKRL